MLQPKRICLIVYQQNGHFSKVLKLLSYSSFNFLRLKYLYSLKRTYVMTNLHEKCSERTP